MTAATPRFGGDGTGPAIDLTEPLVLLALLGAFGVGLIGITAGSPYYNPHIQRPAYFPPSDGYTPRGPAGRRRPPARSDRGVQGGRPD